MSPCQQDRILCCFLRLRCLFLWLLLANSACVVTRKRCPSPPEYRNKTIREIITASQKKIVNNDKKAVVFGLYGSVDKFLLGTIRNVKLVKKLYPSWDAVVFIDPSTVPQAIRDELKVQGAILKEDPRYNRAAARFFIVDDPNYDYFIVRDVDSRINHREVVAVADWLQTDFALHNMHDWPSHKNPLMGGMWGGRSAAIRSKLSDSLENLYIQYIKGKNEVYGVDEAFLKDVVLTAVGVDKLLTHESFYCDSTPNSRGFPIPLGPGLDAIGGQFSE